MPSRLVFICPCGTTSAGTERSTSLPIGEAVERQPRRLGVSAGGLDVDVIFEQFQRQAGGLGGLIGQHHRGRAGVDHHRGGDAVDPGLQREFAALSARDLHGARGAGAPLAQQFRDGVAGARDPVPDRHRRPRRRRSPPARAGRAECGSRRASHAQCARSVNRRVAGRAGGRRAEPARRRPCAPQAAPSPPAARRCPSGASARSPASVRPQPKQRLVLGSIMQTAIHGVSLLIVGV